MKLFNGVQRTLRNVPVGCGLSQEKRADVETFARVKGKRLDVETFGSRIP